MNPLCLGFWVFYFNIGNFIGNIVFESFVLKFLGRLFGDIWEICNCGREFLVIVILTWDMGVIGRRYILTHTHIY